MRAIIGFCFLLAAVWAGHWFWAKSNFETDHQTWRDSQSTVKYQTRTVQGFPNRLDTDLTALRVDISDGHITLPRLFIAQLVYKKHHKVVVAQGPMAFNWLGRETLFTFDDARASAEFDDQRDLQRIILIIKNLGLAGQNDFPIGVDLNLELDATEDRSRYNARLRLKSIDAKGGTLAFATGQIEFNTSLSESSPQAFAFPRSLSLDLSGTYKGMKIKDGHIKLDWRTDHLAAGLIKLNSATAKIETRWDAETNKWTP